MRGYKPVTRKFPPSPPPLNRTLIPCTSKYVLMYSVKNTLISNISQLQLKTKIYYTFGETLCNVSGKLCVRLHELNQFMSNCSCFTRRLVNAKNMQLVRQRSKQTVSIVCSSKYFESGKIPVGCSCKTNNNGT